METTKKHIFEGKEGRNVDAKENSLTCRDKGIICTVKCTARKIPPKGGGETQREEHRQWKRKRKQSIYSLINMLR